MKDITDLFLENMSVFWFTLGALFVLIETMIFFVIFFLSGIACFSVGLLCTVFPNISLLYQLLSFLFFLSFWTGILYGPLKRNMQCHLNDTKYSSILGSIATIIDEDLVKGRVGSIRWSGTICRAMIIDFEQKEIFKEGDEVIICRIDGNIFYVKSID